MKTSLNLTGTALLAATTLSILFAGAPAHGGPGYALSFDGVNDWADMQAAVIPVSGDFTVECWVRCPTAPSSTREILSQGSSGNAFYVGTDANNNFRLGDSWVTTGIPFPVGDWHHIAVISRSSIAPISALYVDGQFRAAQNNKPLANPQASTGLRLGRQYGTYSEYWPGQIDEVRIWNVSRSPADIQANMNRALIGNESNLVGYWRCDEGGGITLADGTGHGHTGTLSGSPMWAQSGIPFVPDVATDMATGISLTEATLNGSVNACNLPTLAWFEWGTNTSYGNRTPTRNLSAANAAVALSAGLSNLTPGLTYHFRLVATNSVGLTLGSDWSFGLLFPPTVATLAASSVGPDSTTLNGSVDPHGLSATAWFQWGPDLNYGNLTAAKSLSATNGDVGVSLGATNLIPGVTYHFILMAVNDAGINLGSDQTFTVLSPPSVVTLAASSLGLDRATLNGAVNPKGLPATAWFEWGTDTSYGNTTAATNLPGNSGNFSVSSSLRGLTRGQTYHFRVTASNRAGVTPGNDQSFPTLASPSISVISDRTVSQGGSTGLILFTLADPDTPLDSLMVTVHSANPVLVPNTPQALALGGTGAQRSLQVVPAANHSGAAEITVTASDGTSRAKAVFKVTVLPSPTNSVLQFSSSESLPPQRLRFRFRDPGTGATNYVLEFLPDLSSGNLWTNASDVTITPLAQGEFRADIAPPPGVQGFYRIKGFKLLSANFDTTTVAADRGSGEAVLVILFDAPFQGTLYYSISGTAGTNDYAPLSGQVQVNGTTAAIPITLRDVPSEFTTTLVLTLQGGAGFQLGASRRASISIAENQDDWQGAFVVGQTSLGFVMRILHQDGCLLASFVNSQFSFFPTNELPVELSFTADSFAARVANIPVSAEATLLNTPMMLTLQLNAANGQTNETVNSKRVQGVASLVSQVPGRPHLSTTNRGLFLLIKPPALSPTNQVDLVPAL